MTLIAYAFPKLQTTKELVRAMSKMHRFRTHFDIEHGKGSQTLLKATWQHFYHMFSSLQGTLTCKMSLFVIYQILYRQVFPL